MCFSTTGYKITLQHLKKKSVQHSTVLIITLQPGSQDKAETLCAFVSTLYASVVDKQAGLRSRNGFKCEDRCHVRESITYVFGLNLCKLRKDVFHDQFGFGSLYFLF